MKLTVYLTVIGCLILFVGWVIPYWFARRYGLDRKTEWGLFYSIVCELGRCQTIGRTIRTGSVDFLSGTSGTVEHFAIPVLATISFGLAMFCSLLCIYAYTNCCFSIRSSIPVRRFHTYMAVATLLTTTVVFTFITIVVAGFATAQFFQHHPISSVIEVPWALICYLVGEIFFIFSDIFFILFIRKYLEYRRLRHSSDKSNSGVFPISLRYYYPGKYSHLDYEVYTGRPYYLHAEYEFDHFGTGKGPDEPPPDYEMDTFVMKSSPGKRHNLYISKPGYKRIPRRYRHPHEVDNGEVKTAVFTDLTTRNANYDDNFADRSLPLLKDIYEHKETNAHKKEQNHIKIKERSSNVVQFPVWHKGADYQSLRHQDEISSSSSDAAFSDYQLKVINQSREAQSAVSGTSVSFFLDTDRANGTMKTDGTEGVSVWYTPRDYGTLTYVGNH